MCKKLILILMTIPFLGFGQNKTEKVATQVGAAAVITAGVIGLFKKKKDKNNTTEMQNPTKSKTSANPDGTFAVNAKPEDIVAKLYKCTYKKPSADYTESYCLWKPSLEDFSKLKQNSEDGAWSDYNINLTLAAAVDTVMAFRQNGIDNIVIAVASHELNDYGGIADFHSSGAFTGFIRMQNTDGKLLKLTSTDKLMLYTGSFGNNGDVNILKLDDENNFYKITDSQMHQGFADTVVMYYDLNGKAVMSYDDHNSAGYNPDDYEDSETKMDIDKVNKTIKLISINQRYKNEKLVKNAKETIATYQYGNGTITEIPTPKPAIAIQKTTAVKKTTKKK